jgi:hypothetical protein
MKMIIEEAWKNHAAFGSAGALMLLPVNQFQSKGSLKSKPIPALVAKPCFKWIEEWLKIYP